jgi:hypothetical protein
MATTTEWHVVNLERETDDGYVFTAHYTVDANDGTYTASAYGSLGLERPETLVPFAQLTEAIVIGWVKDKLSVGEIEAALQEQLNQQHAPTKAAGVPWQ